MGREKPPITVRNLHKEFRIYERPQDRLAELILRRPRHRLFHVLNDISFAVESGRSLGIIGNNGAGKSTLLKLLVGTLQPTSGQIDIQGQVAALLELGAGFHHDFSGRRNIHLNASLLGVPDEDMGELEREIIDFSELGYFIDRPVRTYSSGMFVRLAFSIATLVRPDILVIDEALSVGDMAFQRKCVQRMQDFRAQRKTMVFCSHSMFHVQELCDTAIWLDKGSVRELGGSEEVVGHYEDFCTRNKSYNTIQKDLPAAAGSSAQATEVPECRIKSLSVRDAQGNELTTLKPLGEVVLEMEIEALRDGATSYFGFAFMRSAEEPVASFLTVDRDDIDTGPFRQGEIVKVSVTVRNVAMRVGDYYVVGGLCDETGLLWYETRYSKLLTVEANKGVGPLTMPAQWAVTRKPLRDKR
ncbi:MAG: polysaccharide ABC transporter ATP-binding protein [Gammaproteobacteria bacterium]|nr:polysaccharide ABC transporter ATP-binding protein [Gammaproteobacteria bacterium]